MPVFDTDYLADFVEFLPDLIHSFKEQAGNILREILLPEIFAQQGPATISRDPIDPGPNPQWEPLSDITVRLKGSSGILVDTGDMRAFANWRIEESEAGGGEDSLKFGWFEDSGDRAYIAAIHEFGLTGRLFQTESGEIMGAQPAGRTEGARARIRAWLRSRLGINHPGIVRIPERSMLRKCADLIEPRLEGLMDTAIIEALEQIRGLDVEF